MIKIKALAVMILMMVCTYTASFAQGVTYRNPLINPQLETAPIELHQNIKNILLLGIDKDDAAAGKGSDYHTDAILVVAVNMDANRMDLISFPRDTLAYVPGVKGIYKLNAAINCGGEKTEDGFQKVSETVSWLLGGIRIDYYCAVDMKTMAAIGDAIGGVDFELEMSYTGDFGKYRKGLQHLDGQGIVDYMRARKNATANANDLGRTARQRDMTLAILKKAASNPIGLPAIIMAIQRLGEGFYTNMSTGDMLALLPLATKIHVDSAGSYIITGKYRRALGGWNFTFTDQDHRQMVIQAVYGVDVPKLQYISYAYASWLMENGFVPLRYLAVAKQLRDGIDAAGLALLSAEQQDALVSFDLAYHQAAAAFDAAADSMSSSDTKRMEKAAKALRKQGNTLSGLFKDQPKPVWTSGKYWYTDRMINQADVNFR